MPDEINFQGFFLFLSATVGIFFTTKARNRENTKRKFNFVLSFFRVFVLGFFVAYVNSINRFI
jgi:hypothetical protein